MQEVGVVVKAALGDVWPSSHQRVRRGLPTLGEIIADDPMFMVSKFGQLVSVKLNLHNLRALARQTDQEQGGGTNQLAGRGPPDCPHYLKFGWCQFQPECTYKHPPLPAGLDMPSSAGEAASAGDASDGTESDSGTGGAGGGADRFEDPGNLPVRPGRSPCTYYLKFGWCGFGARCWHTHPPRDPESSSGGGGGGAAGTSDAAGGGRAAAPGYEPVMAAPSARSLADAVIDVVWPPRCGKDVFLKGALAKCILDEAWLPCSQVHDSYQLLMARAGICLCNAWTQQSLYDSQQKPYASLSGLLEGEVYITISEAVVPGGAQYIRFHLLSLIQQHTSSLARVLAGSVVDALWDPGAGAGPWLRGALARRLLQDVLKPPWLLQVLGSRGSGEGPEPTAFRMKAAAAGAYLREVWKRGGHAYDTSEPPWLSFKRFIADDSHLFLEMSPSPDATAADQSGAQDVTLDVSEVLAQLRRLGAAGAAGPSPLPPRQQPQQQAAEPSDAGGTGKRGGNAGCAGGGGRGALNGGLAGGGPGPGAGGAGPSTGPAGGGAGRGAGGSGRGGGPRHWTAGGAPGGGPGLAAVEVAVKRVLKEGDFMEMLQHLELCQLLAIACASYARRPKLLQVFAPYSSMYSLVMPATIYIIDTDLRQAEAWLSNMKPFLEDPRVVKVVHSSKQWSAQLSKYYDITLSGYVDTQQAHYLCVALRCEMGKLASPQHQLPSAAEFSLSSLLSRHNMYHPYRHSDRDKDKNASKQWQVRPLTDEMVDCAAADVAYLIPVFEEQALTLASLAREVKASQAWRALVARGANGSSTTGLTHRLVEEFSRGPPINYGSVDMPRLVAWAGYDLLHQEALITSI